MHILQKEDCCRNFEHTVGAKKIVVVTLTILWVLHHTL